MVLRNYDVADFLLSVAVTYDIRTNPEFRKKIKDLDTYLHFRNPQLRETLHISLPPPGSYRVNQNIDYLMMLKLRKYPSYSPKDSRL